jgi:alpha-1,6-mannosyltransferase
VLVAFNPFWLLFGLGGDHNDALPMLCILGAVALCLARREELGLGALVGAVAIKASAGLLLPVAVLAGGRWRRTVPGALAGVLLFGGTSLLVFGSHLPGISTQSKLVTSFSIPNLIGWAIGRGGEDATVRLVAEIVLVAGTGVITVWAWRRRALVAGLGWVTLLTLVTLGWDMPWYVFWLLPFLALVPQRSLRIAGALLVVYMGVQWLPGLSTFAHHHWHFDPASSAVGHHNVLLLRSLLR